MTTHFTGFSVERGNNWIQFLCVKPVSTLPTMWLLVLLSETQERLWDGVLSAVVWFCVCWLCVRYVSLVRGDKRLHITSLNDCLCARICATACVYMSRVFAVSCSFNHRFTVSVHVRSILLCSRFLYTTAVISTCKFTSNNSVLKSQRGLLLEHKVIRLKMEAQSSAR